MLDVRSGCLEQDGDFKQESLNATYVKSTIQEVVLEWQME